MNAETLARTLAIAVGVILLVGALVSQGRQSLREPSPPLWRVVVLTIGLGLVFQLIDWLTS